jgi:hypothetical protein
VALYNILFDIAARTAKFEEGMTRVDRRLEGMQRQAGKIGQSLKSLFIVGGAAAFVREMAAAGDEMKTLAERTGRSVESLSQLDYVAQRGNTSLESLIKGQDQLAKKMGATDDEGKAVVKVLDELGLSANRLRSLSPDQQLDMIADAMGGIEDPTRRARIEMTLFGKAGTELDPILRSGAGGIRELREEADRLGITIDALEAERLSKLDDQLEATAGQFRKLKTEIAGVLAQPVGAYFELLQKGFVGWRAMLSVTGDEMEEINEKLEALRMEQRKLQDEQRHIGESQRRTDRLQEIRDEMALLAERQEFLLSEPRIMARFEADMAAIRAKQNAAAEEAAKKVEEEAKAAEEAAKAYARMRAEIKELIEQEKFLNSLELKYPTPLLDDAEFEREIDKAGAMIEKGAKEDQKVLDEIYKENAENFGDSLGEMTVFAEQAFRNIQSYLADFLFDPFDKGIKGMLRGFINVIRRMAAEIAAAQLLKGLGLAGPGGGFLGTALGALFGSVGGSVGGGSGGGGLASSFRGLAAEGKTLHPGEWAIAGEKGPEPVFGGTSGATIVPMDKMGRQVQRNISISAPLVISVDVDSRSDRAAIQQDVDRIVRAGIGEYHEFWRDQLSRGAFA